MAKVASELSMSLDGYIAHPDDTIDHLFDWYFDGDVEIPTGSPALTFHVNEPSATHVKETFAGVGALVAGRRIFDVTDGWGGRHTVDAPVVVVTHSVPEEWKARFPDAPFTFVTEGVERAIEVAKDIAGDKVVSVAGPNVIQQCINLGLMDEITISLIPVLIGEGISFFGELVKSPVQLEGPTIVEGKGVTHLTYRVKR
jgi:dihydrofolate reductase